MGRSLRLSLQNPYGHRMYTPILLYTPIFLINFTVYIPLYCSHTPAQVDYTNLPVVDIDFSILNHLGYRQKTTLGPFYPMPMRISINV